MFNIDWPLVAVLLIFCHSLADYPLQGDFLAQGKNRHTPLGKIFWPHALFAHASIHGGFVAIITGFWWMGLLETLIHGYTDWLKCESKISMAVDQTIHFACKALWLLLFIYLK